MRAARIQANVHDGATVFCVTVWEIGETTIFAYPGEAYSELQQCLRGEFPERTILFLNLANGPHMGYIAPKIAHDDQRYPAWQSPLKTECFDILVDACRNYLKGQVKYASPLREVAS